MSFSQRLHARFNNIVNAIADAFLIERAPTVPLDSRLSERVGQEQPLTSNTFELSILKDIAATVPLEFQRTAKGNLALCVMDGVVERDTGRLEFSALGDSRILGRGHDEQSILNDLIGHGHRAIGVFTLDKNKKTTGCTIYKIRGHAPLTFVKTGYRDFKTGEHTAEPGFEGEAKTLCFIRVGI